MKTQTERLIGTQLKELHKCLDELEAKFPGDRVLRRTKRAMPPTKQLIVVLERRMEKSQTVIMARQTHS
jgi:hypothetical protein